MPVDITGDFSLPTANAEHPGINLLGVRLICGIGSMDTDKVTGKPLRAVTLLTGLAGGAKVLHRSWNRTLIVTGKDGNDLGYATELRPDQIVSSRTNMTLRTEYPGMRRGLIDSILRIHHLMTETTTEGSGIGKFHELIATDDQ
jgi:hypothetical protein